MKNEKTFFMSLKDFPLTPFPLDCCGSHWPLVSAFFVAILSPLISCYGYETYLQWTKRDRPFSAKRFTEGFAVDEDRQRSLATLATSRSVLVASCTDSCVTLTQIQSGSCIERDAVREWERLMPVLESDLGGRRSSSLRDKQTERMRFAFDCCLDWLRAMHEKGTETVTVCVVSKCGAAGKDLGSWLLRAVRTNGELYGMQLDLVTVVVS